MKCYLAEVDVNSRLSQLKGCAYLDYLMNHITKSEKRIVEQAVFANQLMTSLPVATKDRWDSVNSSHKFFAHQGKEVVSYLLVNGKPSVTNVMTCETVEVSLPLGLTSTWSDNGGNILTIGYTPVEVEENCFLYHPKSSHLESVMYHGEPSLKFSMLYSTARNPGSLRDGLYYLLERAVFDDFIWGKN